MPAVLSALFSAIFAAFANKSLYRNTLYAVFPAMEQREMNNETMIMDHHHEPVPFGVSRSDKVGSWIKTIMYALPLHRDTVALRNLKLDTSCWALHPLLHLPLSVDWSRDCSWDRRVSVDWRRRSSMTTRMRGRCPLKWSGQLYNLYYIFGTSNVQIPVYCYCSVSYLSVNSIMNWINIIRYCNLSY